MPDKKIVAVEFVGTTLKLSLDPNKDGQAVAKLEVDLAEVWDEIASAVEARKAEGK